MKKRTSTGRGERPRRFEMSLSEDEAARWRAAAEDQGVSLSALVTAAVEAHLAADLSADQRAA